MELVEARIDDENECRVAGIVRGEVRTSNDAGNKLTISFFVENAKWARGKEKELGDDFHLNRIMVRAWGETADALSKVLHDMKQVYCRGEWRNGGNRDFLALNMARVDGVDFIDRKSAAYIARAIAVFGKMGIE
jgi:hypothetical protein